MYDDVYCDDVFPEEHGYYHESEIPDPEHSKEMLNGIMDALFSSGSEDLLNFCLEELCFEYKIPFKNKPLKI